MNHYCKSVFLTVIALAGISSCQEKMPEADGVEGNVEILAKIDEGIKTRTCVDGDTSDGAVGILWLPGDRIGVFGDAGTANAPFSSANTGAVAEAVFAGSLKTGEDPLYAYYPYSEENSGADVSSVKGNLALGQTFDMSSGALESDYKIGTVSFTSVESGRYEFTFEHLFSLLRFDIDASGTALEGDNLEQIILTLPEGRRLGGEFVFDASSGEVSWTGTPEVPNRLAMNWSDTPALADGASYTGYITCAPDIHAGDRIEITIVTSKYRAEFVRTALVDFAANTCYTFPLALKNYSDIAVTERPVISSFSFEVAKNQGKILDTRLHYDEADGTTCPVGVSAEALEISSGRISGCIPYLYDFSLVPTFEVPDGVTVTVDGTVQESGVSGQDFSSPVEYVVSNGKESVVYTVEVTNTGLPVVVLEQEGEGGRDWQEAGLKVRSKEEDWGGNDRFSLYNADGTVDIENAQLGFRLRGNSTQNFPKLPFALKFDKKVGPQGLPTDKRWELLANWMDRTMLRNTVAQYIAHRTAAAFADGLGWNPRGFNVELVINGRHVGNYYLCEKVKIDADRIDIRECYEDVVDGGNADPSVSDCGYLLEFDDGMDEVNTFRTGRGLPVMFKDEVPKDGEIFNAIKQKVENIEAYIESGNYQAAYENLNINSVIDYFFVQELTFNNEYKHPKSVYMYIDGDGPLTAGPVWDFDWQTFIIPDQVRQYSSIYLEQLRETDEWLYGGSKLAENDAYWPWEGDNYDYVNDMPYMWYPLLFKDSVFRSRVQERWAGIYPYLTAVTEEIDRLAEMNRVSDRFNSAMWPTTSALKNECNAGFNGDEQMTFEEAIASLKKAYTERLEWMNGRITAGNFVTDAE